MNIVPRISTASRGKMRIILYTAAMVFALAALAAGLYGRFADLGGRQMAVDEFYMTQSIRFILESGLPAYPDGGYYLRAIPYQYLTAALSLVLKDTVLAARLIAALFSVASVVLVYLYSRRFLDRPLALAVALSLLVSSWDIEFARFGRMYAMLQFMTLLFLWTYDEAFFRVRRSLRYAPHALMFLTVLTHSLGILLAPLLFVPVAFGASLNFFRSRAEMVRFVTAGIATLVFCYLLISVDMRNAGVTAALPDGFPLAVGSRFSMPVFPFWALSVNPLHNLAFVIALMGGTAALLLGARRFGFAVKDTDIVLALSLISATAHLLAVTILLLALLVFRYGIPPARNHPKRAYVMLALVLLIAVGWLIYAMSNREWIGLVDDGQFSLLWSTRRTFFGWPDLYSLHLVPWLRQLPDVGLLLAFALAYTMAVTLHKPLPKLLRHPAAILVFLMLELSLFTTNLGTLRYVFFLYAVMLCALAWAINDCLHLFERPLRQSFLSRPYRLAVPIYLGVFAWASDFNPSHIAGVTGPDVSYRIGEFDRFSNLWYPRTDFKSPAHFVNSQRSEGDGSRVIVIAQQPTLFYLEGERAIYVSRTAPNFSSFSRAKGTVNIWTGDPLLGDESAVRDYSQGAEVVWLIREKRYMTNYSLDIDETWASRLVGFAGVYESLDKRLEVIRIELADAE